MRGKIIEYDGFCGRIKCDNELQGSWHFSNADILTPGIRIGMQVEFLTDIRNSRGPRAINISKAW